MLGISFSKSLCNLFMDLSRNVVLQQRILLRLFLAYRCWLSWSMVNPRKKILEEISEESSQAFLEEFQEEMLAKSSWNSPRMPDRVSLKISFQRFPKDSSRKNISYNSSEISSTNSFWDSSNYSWRDSTSNPCCNFSMDPTRNSTDSFRIPLEILLWINYSSSFNCKSSSDSFANLCSWNASGIS